jgi:hypothetical protein
MLRRPNNGDKERGNLATPSSAGTWGTSLPTLWEFLASQAYEDGTGRVTGTVMVFVEQGRVKAWVHDRDNERQAFITGQSPDDLLAVLNDSLEADDLDWRPTGRKPGGKK